MVIDFLKYLWSKHKREKYLSNKRYIFDKDTKYVLFSGTSLGDDDLRHLNDLYLMLFLLNHYGIEKDDISLVADNNIIIELEKNTSYNDEFSDILRENTAEIINPEDFTSVYIRNSKKNLVFIATGHGGIKGLHLSKSNTYISSDYFEDISSRTHDTLLIMSQCYAGAFHHLDTRKNICVIGSSEYQKSLSLNVNNILTYKGDDGKRYYREEVTESLYLLITNKLCFNTQIHNINPFLLSLFLALIEPGNIGSKKKHLINVYKKVASFTAECLSGTNHHLSFIKDPRDGSKYYVDDVRLTQQSFLLNKIIASRFFISDKSEQ